jgi:sulfite exporter TauE/SafE
MIWTAFTIGILGSVHCVGMCGPIALALPIPDGKSRYAGIFLYNIGRVISYGLLGIFFGLFGSLFAMAGFQQTLSVIAGTIILLFVFNMLGQRSGWSVSLLPASWKEKITKLLARYLGQRSLSALFMTGLLNGLLPCGLVYVAIVAAVATGALWKGSVYMMMFGLGTLPVMMALAYFKNRMPTAWRYRLLRLVPLSLALLGTILILRGLNLGIPYLSPEVVQEHHPAGASTPKMSCH